MTTRWEATVEARKLLAAAELPTSVGDLDWARIVIHSRRAYMRTKEQKALLIRIAHLLANNLEAREAMWATLRLGGHRKVSAYLVGLARAAKKPLTSAERQERLTEGRAKRSAKLAQRATRELAAAQLRLAAAQKAVARAEVSIKKWNAKVRYYAEKSP